MRFSLQRAAYLAAVSTLATGVLGADILKTNGFSTCVDDPDIQVQKMNIQYDRASNQVTFDVAGTNAKARNVTAILTVTAYGQKVFTKSFDPCDDTTKVAQLCPVPEGTFAAQGSQPIPESAISQVPSIAFTIPDLDGDAKLELQPQGGGADLACIQSSVTNGKSLEVPAVSYVAAGIAGAALVLSGLSAALAAGQPGHPAPSPNFGEVIGWFQGIATNGMLSVTYPGVYRSFTKNFAFSTGLVSWSGMQTTIDNFRASTGGNLTDNSYQYLQNTTLVYTPNGNTTKRSLDAIMLFGRDVTTSVNSTTSGNSTSTVSNNKFVSGIQAYVEQFSIPTANTFMTVLLIFAIAIAAIIVGILLFKVILETWALFASFPKNLTGFRKHYWWYMAKWITNLILLLYGVWTLYCVYQFTNGDSWAAKVLAGVTFAAFTAVLLYFTFRIWQMANKYKKIEGDASGLFEDKETWRKYSLFYENYKKSYWWLFVPTIVYMFAKGCIIAGADGHGLAQTAGQLVVESLLLLLLLWSRPFTLKAGNVINIIIQIVRVLSVVCILVFVEELGVNQTTKTITGVVLIVLQSVLTGVLAILIAVNSIVICCRENPHAKRRRAAKKMNRDLDNLTPLDARNSLLMDPTEYKRPGMVSPHPTGRRGYDPVPAINEKNESRTGLLADQQSIGVASHRHERSMSPPVHRAPTLPDVGPLGGQYRGPHAY